MGKILGALFDSYWPIAVSVAGAVILALFGTIWQESDKAIGGLLTIIFVCLAAIASVFGGVWMAVAQELRTQRTESDLFTALRSTIIPIAERAISSITPVVGQAHEDFATELTLQCRALVKKNTAMCDANLYALKADRLELVNRPSRDARRAFKKTTKKNPDAIEEKCTIDRVVAGQVTFCPDVQNARWQQVLSLAPKKRDYRSFISIPIFDKNREVIGMLSINSPDKKGLSDLHRSYLEAAAKIYAKAVEA